jgi:5-methylcytosine-specific restriction endonuclease McrA
MKSSLRYYYAYGDELEFIIRCEGVQTTYVCKRLKGHRKRIQRARALLIGEKVITAQWRQHWTLNKKRTRWIFYAWRQRVASIPVHEVYWALSGSSKRNDADVESYQNGKITWWTIVKRVSRCTYCDIPGELASDEGDHICNKCLKRMDKLKSTVVWDNFRNLSLPQKRIKRIRQQDRSSTLRWVREFAAQGKFTASEFKALCQLYGNICLRCRKDLVLVPDHVIPLALGGKNEITNIQPLCKRCNGQKGTKLTDYRGRWHRKAAACK